MQTPASWAGRAHLGNDAVVDVVLPRTHICHIVPQRHPDARERNLPPATHISSNPPQYASQATSASIMPQLAEQKSGKLVS